MRLSTASGSDPFQNIDPSRTRRLSGSIQKSKQCDAPRTVTSLMRTPPQKWEPDACIDTCHGHRPRAASSPRIMAGREPVCNDALPQSKTKKILWTYTIAISLWYQFSKQPFSWHVNTNKLHASTVAFAMCERSDVTVVISSSSSELDVALTSS